VFRLLPDPFFASKEEKLKYSANVTFILISDDVVAAEPNSIASEGFDPYPYT
jgi:hypothetical protein